jgi:hypothetical protein
VTTTRPGDWTECLDRAREAVAAAVPPTPVIPAPTFGEGVLLKLESFQPTGSFKVRGALAAVASIQAPLRRSGGRAWSARLSEVLFVVRSCSCAPRRAGSGKTGASYASR